MAMMRLSNLPRRETDDAEEEDEEVWVKDYSSNHQILLVGEGDFSFSLSLATLFGSASNICASSLDSYDNVVKKYKKASSNLETLKRLGAFLLHGVDATRLHLYPDLRCRRFDRVIFNFPHAGFHGKESDSSLIRKHRELVFGFFNAASRLLRPDGEVHVSHKNKAPFCHWNLEELASRCFLVLIQLVAFDKSNYPGYENKRGDGTRCDQPFLLGECSTFKFRFSRVAKELYAEKLKRKEVKEQELNRPRGFIHMQPVSFDFGYPQQAEFQGVCQRSVSFDLRYPQQAESVSQRPVSFDLIYSQQAEFQGVCQRSVSFDLRYPQQAESVSQRPVSFDLIYSQQTEFHDVSQRPISFDLSYPGDYNNKQARDPCFQSRQRTSPIDPYYHQEHRYSQFEDSKYSLGRNSAHIQDNTIELDKIRYTERSSLLCQDFHFHTNHHRQEQFYGRSIRLRRTPLDIHDGITERMLRRTRFANLYAGEPPKRQCDRPLCQEYPTQTNHHRQEHLYESSSSLNGVTLDINDRIVEGMLRRTRFPHLYSGESPGNRRLCQEFPVQASERPLVECSNRTSGVCQENYNWEVGRPSTSTWFPHPYTGESQGLILGRESNLNIHHPQHWIH